MAICVSVQCQKHGPLLADEITNWLWQFSRDPPLPPPSFSRTLFCSCRRLPPPATTAAVIVVTAITVILSSDIAVADIVLVSLPPLPLHLPLPILVDCCVLYVSTAITVAAAAAIVVIAAPTAVS